MSMRVFLGITYFVLFADDVIGAPLYEIVNKIENPNGPIAGSGDEFGFSIAQIGDNIVIGAYRDDMGAENAGAAYLFDRNGNLLRTINNPTPEPDDWFAFEVRSVQDKILIGAENDSTAGPGTGSVYVYDQQGNLLKTISNPNPGFDDKFGRRMIGVGDRILVTAQEDDTRSINAGTAYLFDQEGNLLQEFFSPNPIGYNFSRSVASVGGDKVLISAYREPVDGLTDVGAAYLFDLEGNLLQTFQNPDPGDNDFFGIAVAAVGDDKALVGAIEHTPSNPTLTGGRAYLFDLQGDVLAEILNPTPASQDWFGRAVTAVGENRFLIGAPFDKTLGLHTGAAYLYNTAGELLHTFLPPEPVANGQFGQDLATSDDLILIGSHFDGGINGPGAVYVYAPVPPLPGDFNDDSIIDQADLDLVLLNWGADATVPPDGWISNLPSGLIDQAELDNVLLDWGQSFDSEAAGGTVPEPAAVQIAGLVIGAAWGCSLRQRAVQVNRKAN
jgi:hypothetical protein